MTTSGPGVDSPLCGLKLGNAEGRPTHYTVVTYTSYVRTRISAATFSAAFISGMRRLSVRMAR